MYTIEKAYLITEQLRKFTTGYTHHVVGHFANIDFWIHEVIEALKAIDEHKKRFDNIYNTQKYWTEEHGTIVHGYCQICNGRCEFSDGKPTLPKLKYKSEKIDSRRELVDAAYFFLARCYRIGLLTSEDLKKRCDSIGTSIDPNDLD
ncbi:hypothetical protein IMCC3317_38500 [Kordia antarctica]|uniref:Uncharacterized protein n=1 Tax=Kordia antarctica TaxID=1218801 RepID=A0A7L4ZPQ9_9FLAO|nr:hypothetical protein [Kordia antarctica]QHI38457.1 hypothetical protein IMCC3317_38500 [Kordia antarctica]